MRLTKVNIVTTLAKLSLKVPETFLKELEAYSEYYQHCYKENITKEDLAKEMLSQFLRGDKAFQKWRETQVIQPAKQGV